MTTPTQTAQPPSVPQQIQDHDDAALALEVAAAVAATKVLREQLDAIVKSSLLAWTKAFGSLRSQQTGAKFLSFMEQLSADLAQIRFDPRPVLLDYSARARQLGIRQGFREAGESPADLGGLRDFGATVDATQAATRARERIETAARLAGVAREGSYTAVSRAIAPAQQAANQVEATAHTMTNTALNQGIADVAEEVGGKLLWVAERDACRVCLALSGHVVSVGEEFDVMARFAGPPLKWIPDGGLTRPPRHPRCRCRCTVWRGSAGPLPVDLPQALRREAERSVLLGFARPSESERVREQAADRLLARIGMAKGSRSPSGWATPQSVKERTERALRRGTFTTRSVPVPGKK